MRRTVIKDVSAYCAFLLGFIGAAPFAWQYLTAELQSGEFVRGLWYFFALISVSGLVCGVTGLALGNLGGALWEQLHRHGRARNQRESDTSSSRAESLARADEAVNAGRALAVAEDIPTESPALRLVPDESPSLPELSGRLLSSVRFLSDRVELEFTGGIVLTTDYPVVTSGLQRFRYPDAGSRDALCNLIGASVDVARTVVGERLELRFGRDRQMIVPNIRSRIVTLRGHS